MNRKIALALAIASAAAASAFADDGAYQPDPFISTRTRAEVMAELQGARQAGVDAWAEGYGPAPQMRSTLTRGEVTRAYLATRDAVAALNGEDSGSVYLARREAPQAQPTQFAVAPDAGLEE